MISTLPKTKTEQQVYLCVNFVIVSSFNLLALVFWIEWTHQHRLLFWCLGFHFTTNNIATRQFLNEKLTEFLPIPKRFSIFDTQSKDEHQPHRKWNLSLDYEKSSCVLSCVIWTLHSLFKVWPVFQMFFVWPLFVIVFPLSAGIFGFNCFWILSLM